MFLPVINLESIIDMIFQKVSTIAGHGPDNFEKRKRKSGNDRGK